MIPKTLSASSIQVSEACLERWRVENLNRAPQPASTPADTGTACHFALEHFVNAVYIDKKIEWDDVKHLKQFYEIGYIETFGTADTDTDAYRDGAELVAKWYDRNKEGLPNTVLTCEVKETFPIKTSVGEIPFNFIWDRADQIDEDEYEVVDYKSIRMPIRPEDLKEKIQPRAYAVAAQIKWPNAKRIWVTFDMLRHDAPVGVVFTRNENIATYKYLKKSAERIIAINEEDVQETINDECKWCAKKSTCNTLTKAVNLGMVQSMSIDEVAERKLQIASQLQALKYANDELDAVLVKEAEKRDEFEFDLSKNLQVKIGSRPTRKANSNAIANIVGQDLAAKYGNFTVTNIDKMLKSGDLSDDLKSAVKAQITQTWSEPSAKVTQKKDF